MRANPLIGNSDILEGATMSLRIDYRKRPNARRYILRINEQTHGGSVTIPRGGCLAEARSFARRNLRWLEDRLRLWREKAGSALTETTVWFHGEPLPLVVISDTEVLLGTTALRIQPGAESVRARLRLKLWAMARAELPSRVGELAAAHGLAVKRVSVRDQRSRWGSCSAKGVVSLNWRLIQAPDFVRDYIIIHELMHLREMNHSERFWKLVYDAYPMTDDAEKWLKNHSTLLRG